MALSAAMIDVNAKSAALVTSWSTLVKALHKTDEIYVVPMPSGWNNKNIGTATFPACFDGSAVATYMEKIPLRMLADHDGSAPELNLHYELSHVNLGRLPLFWKVTDATGLLSEA